MAVSWTCFNKMKITEEIFSVEDFVACIRSPLSSIFSVSSNTAIPLGSRAGGESYLVSF